MADQTARGNSPDTVVVNTVTGVITTDAIGKPQTGLGIPEPPPVQANTASGKVQALRDVRRELSEEDLKSPGVVKLLLDRLDTSMVRCEQLEAYEQRFHDADKQVGVLTERGHSRVALDIAWGGGVALGAMCIGLAPGLWGGSPDWMGPVVLVLGVLFVVVGIIVRAVMR